MSNDPFRDDRAAAHARADQLARENAQLRKQLDRPRGGPGGGRMVAVSIAVLVALVLLGGVMFVVLARSPSRSREADGLRVNLEFRPEAVPTRGAIRAMSSDQHGAYAVGDNGVILYRDGDRPWTAQASGTNRTLRAVAGGTDATYAVGDGGTALRFDTATRGWVAEATGTTADLYAVTLAAGLPIAAGAGGTILIRRENAGVATWTAMSSGVTSTLRALSSQRLGEATYAVGDGGRVLALAGIVMDPNARWVIQASNTTEDLRAIAGSASEIVAVGAHGTVLRTTAYGAAPWTVERAGVDTTLNALSTASVPYEFHQGNFTESGSRSMLVAAGDHGTLLVYLDTSSGGTSPHGWYALAHPTNATLLGVAGFGSTLALVGEDGTALAAVQR